MMLLKMAWRNVWRNHRRSSITIVAMTLALVAELLYSGLVTGMIHSMEDDATEFDLGDLQVFHEGYLTRPSLYDVVPDAGTLIGKLEEAGYQAAPRLYAGGLGGSGDMSAGVQMVGIDPVRDARTLALSEAMAEGAWLDAADPSGVVVGRGLARTLGLDLGSELLVVSQGADGSIANALYTVRGILMSVAASMDRSSVLMTEDAFRELMVLPEGVHKVIIRRPKDVPLKQAKTQVAALAGMGATDPAEGSVAVEGQAATVETGTDGLDVMTWEEINPFLAQMLAGVSGMVAIVYFIVYLAVAILILNAMLMAVFERIKEFGVLKAIGYSPRQVMIMMILEGLIQASVALVAGLLLAAPGMWWLQNRGVDVGALGGIQMVGMTMPPIWKAHYTWSTVQVPIIMLFVITFIAVLWPALRAARISPVEAMHHQ